MYFRFVVIVILLLNLEYINCLPVHVKCMRKWSVELPYCPLYGTADWMCLKTLLNCGNEKVYHCVRDERGKWIQICAEANICHKGQEPVYSKVSGITCQSCSNPERFEPAENTASYKFSECRRIKKTCPEDISYECPDETVRYVKNRMCRCANEKNFIPQNYDFDTEIWICKDIDDLNCVEDVCPEDANGKEQIRGREYRCYVPPFVPATPSPADRSSAGVISEKPTTRLNRMAGPVEGDKGSPGFMIGLILCMLVLLLILVVILTVYKLKKRNQLGTPVGLKASDITYYTLMLSWEPPKKGYLPTHYILEKRMAKSLIWFRVDMIPAEKTDYHVTGLKAGTLYSFSVVAKNKKGKSKRHETESQVVTKCITVPEVPRGLSGYFDEKAKCIQLRWDLPADDGGTPIIEYIVEYSFDEDWTLGGSVNKDKTEWTQSGLIGGVMYKFRVSARNEEGRSKPAELSEKIQYLSVPSKPATISTTAIKSNTLTLNWRCPESDGGTNVGNYIIRQKQDEYDWQEFLEVKSLNLNVTIKNLKPGKVYYFGVSARNRIGKSDFKETESPTVLQREPAPPDIPVGPLKASNIGYTGLTLSWLPPEDDGGSDLTEYIIEKKDNLGFWLRLQTIGSEKTECHIKGLEEGKLYCFRVKAKNAKGTSKGLETAEQIETKRATRPEKPVGPMELSNMTVKSVTLSWKPPNNNCGSPITGYSIYYRDMRDSDRSYWTSGGLSKNTTLTQKNLPLDGEYVFRVTASNGKGESQPLESSVLFRPKQYAYWFGGSKKKESNTTSTDDVQEAIRNNRLDATEKKAVPPNERERLLVTEDPSYSVQPTEKPSPPLSPLVCKTITHNSMVLSWQPSATDGGAPIIYYKIEYRTKQDPSWYQVGYTECHITVFTVSGLQVSTKYWFRVTAYNSVGASSPLESQKSVKTEKRNELPSQPKDLTVSKMGNNAVTLRWKQPSDDGGSKCIAFVIKTRESTSNEWVQVTVSNSDELTYALRNLPYKDMYISVAAKNSTGIGPAKETDKPVTLKYSLGPPSTPVGPLKALNIDATELTLSWQPPQFEGESPVSSYILHIKSKGSDWEFLERNAPEVTMCHITGLEEKERYCFRVSAENQWGVSEHLEMVGQITTKPLEAPLPPTGLTENLDLTSNSVLLNWKPPVKEASSITGYIVEYMDTMSTFTCWNNAGFVTSDNTTWVQHNLEGGHEYVFRVIGVNEKGQSDPLKSKRLCVPDQQKCK